MKRLLPPILVLSLLVLLTPLFWYHSKEAAIMDRPPPWDVALVLGLVLLAVARIQFAKTNAEIMTFNRPTALVTRGVFRFSRNPMYLGFVFVLMAAALFVNTYCALLAPILFFCAANWWYIPHEERAMREEFGDDYENYADHTRRWI